MVDRGRGHPTSTGKQTTPQPWEDSFPSHLPKTFYKHKEFLLNTPRHVAFSPSGSPSCHQLPSQPRTPRRSHSPGSAFGSCPETGPSNFPAAKYHPCTPSPKCLKQRTCSLLLTMSTTSSNQQNQAKIPGGNVSGCISGPFPNR